MKSQTDTLFMRLFYISHLASALQFTQPFFFPYERWYFILWSMSAALALFFIGSRLAFGVVAFLSFVTLLYGLPELPNHFVMLEVMTAYFGFALLRTRRLSQAIDETKKILAPSAAILYFFAGFAKLNSSYTDPLTSCTNIFYSNITAHLPFLPTSALFTDSLIVASIALELCLAMLLLFRKTRVLAVLMGLVFHLGLALDPIKLFTNFSALMCFMLVNGLTDRELSFFKRHAWVRLALRFWSHFYGVSLLLLSFLASKGAVTVSFVAKFQCLNIATLLALMAMGVFWSWKKGAEKEAEEVGIKRYSRLIVFSFLVLNGLSPYLGLKDGSAFAMYSNLSFSPEGSNHYIVPRSLDLLGLREPIVEVSLDRGKSFQMIPMFEAMRRARKLKAQKLLLKTDGKVEAVLLQDLAKKYKYSAILFKLFHFREVGGRVCWW